MLDFEYVAVVVIFWIFQISILLIKVLNELWGWMEDFYVVVFPVFLLLSLSRLDIVVVRVPLSNVFMEFPICPLVDFIPVIFITFTVVIGIPKHTESDFFIKSVQPR
ncbi:hypothetical protein HALDL1_00960 (plasmid) [Halobacterium sp. DL1]|nr:hypothetical protein HALDL1_00960 [Halobacterium sp. DL1]